MRVVHIKEAAPGLPAGASRHTSTRN